MSMNISPRELRLNSEIKELDKLQSRSRYISVKYSGEPTNKLLITYTCTGVYRDEVTGEVRRTTFHQMEIQIPEKYPNERPFFRWLTPIFHPNIVVGNNVCLGDIWEVSNTLKEYIIDIGELIQYKRFNATNSYNDAASEWVKKNQHTFPVGRENLFELEQLSDNPSKSDGHSVIINNPQNINLNIATTLSDIRQSIKTKQAFNQNEIDEFDKLILQLIQELQKAPKENTQEAEAVAEYAKELIDEVGKENPKKIKINISKEGLLKAAENIASVLPMVLQLAKQIVNHIVVTG